MSQADQARSRATFANRVRGHARGTSTRGGRKQVRQRASRGETSRAKTRASRSAYVVNKTDFPKSASSTSTKAEELLSSRIRFAFPIDPDAAPRRYIKHVAGILALKWSYFFRCLLKISLGNKPRARRYPSKGQRRLPLRPCRSFAISRDCTPSVINLWNITPTISLRYTSWAAWN